MATITSAQSGLWNTGSTWVGGVAPVTGDKVIVAAAHTVTVSGVCTGGDDTSTGVTVNGGLVWSRAVNSSLKVRGDLVLVPSANLVFDMGTEASPIPAGIAARCILNDSAAMASNKWRFRTSTQATTAQRVSFWGADKTPYVLTTGPVTAGTSRVIPIPTVVGWNVGDWIAIPGKDGFTDTQFGIIESIQATSVTLTQNVAQDIILGQPVTNLTRNVRFESANTGFGSNFSFDFGNTVTAAWFELGNVEFRLMAGGSGTTSGTLNIVLNSQVMGADPIKRIYRPVVHNVSALAGSTSTPTYGAMPGGILLFGSQGASPVIEQPIVTVAKQASASAFLIWSGCSATIKEPMIFGAATVYGIGFSQGPVNSKIIDQYIYGGTLLAQGSGIGMEMIRGTIINVGTPYSAVSAIGSMKHTGVTFDPNLISISNIFGTTQPAAAGDVEYSGCTFRPGVMDSIPANLSAAGDSYACRLNFINNNPLLAITFKRGGRIVRDNAVVLSSTSSLRLEPRFLGRTLWHEQTYQLAAGETMALRVNMRKNAAYAGSAPKITLSILGSANVVRTLAAAADVWQNESVSITNTNAYPATATLRVEATPTANSSTASVWFDGFIVTTFVDAARHYGFQLPAGVTLKVDPQVTMTEAAALALPVSVNHTTQTISVNGPITANEFWHACIADLCQTANLSRELHATLNGDGSVTTTYSMAFGASGSIDGAVAAANGNTYALQLLGLSQANVLLLDGAGDVFGNYVAVSGTHKILLPFASSGTWTWVVKRAGYEHAVGTFDPSLGGVTDARPSTPQKVTPEGQPMFTAAPSALVTVNIGNEAEVSIGDGMASLQGTFDAIEISLMTLNGMRWIAGGGDDCSIFNSAGGDYLFLTAGWRLKRDSIMSSNAGINAFVVSTEGVPVDESNGPVRFLTSDATTSIAAAVRAALIPDLAALALQVWEVTATGNKTPGTTGAALQDTSARVAAGL